MKTSIATKMLFEAHGMWKNSCSFWSNDTDVEDSDLIIYKGITQGYQRSI